MEISYEVRHLNKKIYVYLQNKDDCLTPELEALIHQLKIQQYDVCTFIYLDEATVVNSTSDDEAIDDDLTYNKLNDLPDILTVEHVKRYLGIGQNLTYKLINDGTIKSFQVGRLMRIHKSALIEYLDKRN